MAWPDNLKQVARAHRALAASGLDPDAVVRHGERLDRLEAAAFALNAVPLNRVATAFVVGREVRWVGAAVSAVAKRAHQDPAFARQLERLVARLRAALE